MIESVAAAGDRFGQNDRSIETGGTHERSVVLGIGSPPFDPSIHVRQFDPEHSGLQGIDAEISTDDRVLVGAGLAVDPQFVEAGGQVCIPCRDQPCVAETTDVLRREE